MAKHRCNGEGSIYAQRDSSGNVIRWVAQITVGINENGSLKRKRAYAKTKRETAKLLEQLKFQYKTGALIDKSNITIYDLGRQIEQDRFEVNEIGENSFYRNLETLKRLSRIYDTPLQEVTPQVLQSFFISEQYYSQSTLNKEYILLNRIFCEAQKRALISENPMEGMRRPRSKKRRVDTRAMTIEEQQKFISVLQSNQIPHATQMLLSLYTGMRMGEIHALEVKHIDFNRHCIYVLSTISRGQKGEAISGDTTKTRAGKRTIPMSPQIEAMLRKHIGEQKAGLLFTATNNQPLSTCTVNNQFRRVLKKHDIQDVMLDGKLTAHSLRHTYATRCIEADMPPKVLQTLLGHTDISITLNTYCNAFDQFQAEGLAKFADYMEQQGLLL